MIRGQSHVVGVALMLSLTILALGAITAGVGTLFEAQAASADAGRVADDLDAAIQPVEQTGPGTGRVAFSDGQISTVDRGVRVMRNGSVIREIEAGALVFTADDRRVASVAGAIVRGQGSGSWLVRDPPLAASDGEGVLVVSAPKLNGSGQAVAGAGQATLRTDVSHDRTALGTGTFGVAIESETPAAFERYFEREGVPTTRRDFDGDGVDSVVAAYPGTRRGYLVVHDLGLEVG